MENRSQKIEERRRKIEIGSEMKEKAKSFQDLIVWQKAHEFVLEIYRITKNFPKHEIFGLTAQIHRAAISIPANISEGFIKRSKRDKARYMNIAQGSCEEVRYYLILIADLEYTETSFLFKLLDEISKMLNAYEASIWKESITQK